MDDLTERRAAMDAFAEKAAPAAAPAAPIAQIDLFPPSRGAIMVAVERDDRKVLAKMKTLAAAAGPEWVYRFPVKDNKTGATRHIEGPSIKLANDLARVYGNCEVDTRVLDLGNSWMIYARFVDTETGFSLTRPFQQRKAQKSIKTDAGRAEDIAMQIGVSKAIRNVVVNALQTFADFAVDEAKGSMIDRIGKNLDLYRNRIAERLEEIGVDLVRVEAAIGRPRGEWLAPDVARVIAELKAIADGMANADDTYPPVEIAKIWMSERAGEAEAPPGAEEEEKGKGGQRGTRKQPLAS